MKTINILLFVIFMAGACTNEDDLKVPLKMDTTPPAALTSADVSYKPIAGGAIVKYNLPDEKDIRCIEAQYTISNGKKIVTRGSFLSDSLIIEGFRDMNVHHIKLFAVDNSENYSQPFILSITPNQSPLDAVLESLKVLPDFGGMQITWKNIDKSIIALFVYKIEMNDTILLDQYYSKTENGELTIRGQESVDTEFLIQVRDRWDNYTQKVQYNITPLFEKELDYSKFKIPHFSYFINILNYDEMTKWWDGQKSATGWGLIFWPDPAATLPTVSTVKMGVPVLFSRIILWQYAWGAANYSHFYADRNIRKLELYGSIEDTPSKEDPSDNPSWEFIMECEIKMPSGGFYNNDSMTEEDLDVAKNRGHEFLFPLKETPVKYKYLRFKVLSTFEGGPNGGLLSEISLFGDDRADDDLK